MGEPLARSPYGRRSGADSPVLCLVLDYSVSTWSRKPKQDTIAVGEKDGGDAPGFALFSKRWRYPGLSG